MDGHRRASVTESRLQAHSPSHLQLPRAAPQTAAGRAPRAHCIVPGAAAIPTLKRACAPAVRAAACQHVAPPAAPVARMPTDSRDRRGPVWVCTRVGMCLTQTSKTVGVVQVDERFLGLSKPGVDERRSSDEYAGRRRALVAWAYAHPDHARSRCRRCLLPLATCGPSRNGRHADGSPARWTVALMASGACADLELECSPCQDRDVERGGRTAIDRPVHCWPRAVRRWSRLHLLRRRRTPSRRSGG